MQEAIKCIVDKQKLCGRVAEMQLQLDDFLPRFCLSTSSNGLHLTAWKGKVYRGAFALSLAGWQCFNYPLRLKLDAFHWFSLEKWGSDAVQLRLTSNTPLFEQDFTRKTLLLIVHRVAELDVPELHADSRAALHQFLHAAAHLLD